MSVMMHLGNNTWSHEEISCDVGSKETSGIPAGKFQLEKEKKALGGDNALLIFPREPQQIKVVFSVSCQYYGELQGKKFGAQQVTCVPGTSVAHGGTSPFL